MVEDLAGPAPDPAACCAASDPATAGKCVLCSKAVCGNCLNLVNTKPTCTACRDAVLAEAAKENSAPPASQLGRAFGAALAAAVACGIAWAALALAAGIESGFAAVGVGWAVAHAVRWAVEGKRGVALKRLAAACAFFGLLVGKYLIVAHIIVTKIAPKQGVTDLSHLDPRVIQIAARILPHTITPYDLLWIFLAYVTIAKTLSPVKLAVTHARGNPAPAA